MSKYMIDGTVAPVLGGEGVECVCLWKMLVKV